MAKVAPDMTEAWPALPLEAWEDTRATLHMWMQVVGKIQLALTPRTNHFWNVAFQFRPSGLATLPLDANGRTLTIQFDFVAHELRFQLSDGRSKTNPLRAQSVADFYGETMRTLRELGVDVRLWPRPVEIPDPIRFDRDTVHHAYDRDAANAFWRTLLAIRPVFERFRCGFIGKCSPVHFFWGSMDLAVTRFSGRRAPERPDADPITKESYSHEVISHGFWPGGRAAWGPPMPEPVFYAYAAPEPTGLKEARVLPAAAQYSSDFSEFLLPYEAVRRAERPGEDLRAFFESTYEAAARLAGWNRAELERR